MGEWADVRGLKHRADLVAGDRTPALVGLEHHRLERLLSKPLRGQPRVPVHRTWVAPHLVAVGPDVEQTAQQLVEVLRPARVRQVVALALHHVGGKLRRWLDGLSGREEPDIADEDASDDRILTGPDDFVSVLTDSRAHLGEAVRAVVLAEQFPSLGNPKRRKLAVEAAANHAVVGVVGLEEERLTQSQRSKPATAGRPPEVHFTSWWPRCQKAVPLAVGHPDVRLHGVSIAAQWEAQRVGGRPGRAHNLAFSRRATMWGLRDSAQRNWLMALRSSVITRRRCRAVPVQPRSVAGIATVQGGGASRPGCRTARVIGTAATRCRHRWDDIIDDQILTVKISAERMLS